MSKLILLRHGESYWNKKKIFTGWVDVPLSKKGIREAVAAGKQLKETPIDVIITTTLVRAQMTAFLVMSQHNAGKVPVVLHPGEGILDTWGRIHNPETKAQCIPVIYSWEFNERMYGELQGLSKKQTAKKFGEQQVLQWRRSYDTTPPNGESLAMTAARTIPYFQSKVLPLLQQGHNVFICAHGNSLRALCMVLDNLSHEEVLHLEIATGEPMTYEFANSKFKKEK